MQDFPQAELLLDLSVMANPNGLFYCGDTCQTIMRGVGFRFADVRTLIYDEAKGRQEAAEAAAAGSGLGSGGVGIGLPELQELKVNYRTHSGILEVASSVVDLINRYFPRYVRTGCGVVGWGAVCCGMLWCGLAASSAV